MSERNLVLLLFIVGCGVITITSSKKNWDYELQSFQWNSTDPNSFATNMRAIRISRGQNALNGTITVGTDIDNNYQVGMNLLHSASGTSHYVAYPLQVKKDSFYYFMNNVYKKYLMKDLNKCAGLPLYENEWKEPLKSHEFFVNSCVFNTEFMPTHMQDGYYKLILEIVGPKFRYIGEFRLRITSAYMG